MSTRVISLLLLTGRLISITFIALVLRRQLALLRSNTYPKLQTLRKQLLALGVIVLIGNVIPVIIDTYGVFGRGSFGLLLLYVFSNNITAILGSITLWMMYKMSEREPQ